MNTQQHSTSNELPKLFSIGQGMKAMTPTPILPLFCKLVGNGCDSAAVISEPDKNGNQQIVTMSPHSKATLRQLDRHCRPLSEKFGIGLYYNDELECYTKEEVEKRIGEALQVEQNKWSADAAAKEEEAQCLEIGRKLFAEHKPTNAVGCIVAHFYVDKSDPMTDYWGGSIERTVILAFTTTDRNNFAEMKQAAANCSIPEIKALAEGKENRDNYSGGNGYWIGQDRYSGWQIKKGNGFSDRQLISAGRKDGFFAFKQELVFDGGKHPAPATTAKGEARIVHNKDKDGIEIYFNAKPNRAVLDTIKANGWRWSKYNKAWYKRVSYTAAEFAAKYGSLPSSLSEEAQSAANETNSMRSYQEAQEQAMYERG